MTFIAPARPARPADLRAAPFFGRKAPKPKGRPAIPDEDGARRALGADGAFPMAVLAGSSIEHLARIALG